MAYRQIANFAGEINNVSNDPLTYCVPDILNSQFLHGSDGRLFGKHNRQCGIYMSNRCSQNWDNICESMSFNSDTNYPDVSNNPDVGCARLSGGQILVRDTAYVKYLYSADSCNVICEPFNPNVADSPQICYMSEMSCSIGDSRASMCGILKDKQITRAQCGISDEPCAREYSLTDEQIKTLDQDPVMNKLIDVAYIAPILLHMIYNSLKKRGKLSQIKNKRLGKFYELNGYAV